MAKKSQPSNERDATTNETNPQGITDANNDSAKSASEDGEKRKNLRELQDKLATQRARLIQAAEESFLQDGTLLQNKVAEEADKFFALSDSLCEDEDEEE